ncbi:hypothetical protein [Cerasicoccus frondis]|uniref:PDC sensor domain-containing protein n=1 Tax=Cerasicoccus frondis TaxID=490090 RepID=UPI002852955A|nr:hypothetical protein [Cerasicoccus frondis]
MHQRYLLSFLLILATGSSPAKSPTDPYDLLLKSSAQRINEVLGYVAQSTVALADEYQRIRGRSSARDDSGLKTWQDASLQQGDTIGFRFSDAKLEPTYQAPVPAFYYYGAAPLNEAIAHQLNELRALAPVVRTAYESFDFSWVYITTSCELLLIYPYLPFDEAVNNYPPTEQIFYTCADFKNRKSGWSAPYFDLVGAGMMVTVSTPAFVNDKPVAVVSRDITLVELTESVLKNLVSEPDAVAYLVDEYGLVIDVSDPALAKELLDINTKNQAATLYYADKATASDKGGVISQTAWVNEVTAAVLKAASAHNLIQLTAAGRKVLSTRIEATGWRLILAFPQDTQ